MPSSPACPGATCRWPTGENAATAAPGGPLKITADARGLAFPYAARAIQITRRRTVKGRWSRAVTSLSVARASPVQLAAIIRGHWGIEDRLLGCATWTSVKTAPRSVPPAGPALPRPAAWPVPPDDHELLNGRAGLGLRRGICRLAGRFEAWLNQLIWCCLISAAYLSR